MLMHDTLICMIAPISLLTMAEFVVYFNGSQAAASVRILVFFLHRGCRSHSSCGPVINSRHTWDTPICSLQKPSCVHW